MVLSSTIIISVRRAGMGRDDDVVEEELYKGTSKSAEGYTAVITFRRAQEEGKRRECRLPSTGKMQAPPRPRHSVKCFTIARS